MLLRETHTSVPVADDAKSVKSTKSKLQGPPAMLSRDKFSSRRIRKDREISAFLLLCVCVSLFLLTFDSLQILNGSHHHSVQLRRDSCHWLLRAK